MKLILISTLSLIFNINSTSLSCNCDSKDALKKAEASLKIKYGTKMFKKYLPYSIHDYDDSTWIVYGKLTRRVKGISNTNKALGGTHTAYIDKKSCEVIKITHTK